MDRQTCYAGQILPETTLLQMAKDSMIGMAKLSAAVLGTSTMANGFAVTPTGPASLQVVVAPGEIYSLTNIDATAYSSLPADTTHSIMKQGILLDAVTLTCTAPTTTGQSINYLVQTIYQDVDSNPVLLPYYNSANPSLPFSGMGNNGLTQNTARKGAAVVAVKAGVSAATGSQTTPAPDAGYVGLYVVTVAYGQTAITSSSIAQYSGAPILPSGLLQSIQSGNMSFAIDTGTANTYVCAFTPAITARSEGQVLRFKVKTSNTGVSTINDGVGVAPLVGGAHAALQGGELVANGDAWIQWNTSVSGGSYILLFCTGAPEQVAPAAQSQHAVQLGQVGHGQCRLSVASTTSLKLSPYNGNNVIVNGVPLQIPSSGVTVSNSGLNALTVYYVYLSGTTASPILNLSTTGHIQNSNGIEVMSSNTAWSLVGMICTNASSQFIDSTATRTCINWFNRRACSSTITSSSTYNFTNTTAAEITTAMRLSFLTWSDEVVDVISSGEMINSTSGGLVAGLAFIDGVQFGNQSAGTVAGVNFGMPFSSQNSYVITEGFHIVQLCGYVSTGTGTVASGAVNRVVIRG